MFIIYYSNHEFADFKKEAFNCIHCNAFSHMKWDPMHVVSELNAVMGTYKTRIYRCKCVKCNFMSYWFNDESNSLLIFPLKNKFVLDPHIDMPEDIAIDYREAANIVSYSTRGACALLRLAIEKLCKKLGSPNKTLNDNISYLVSKKNLDARVQQSLDLLRVIGNSAVHPGLIDVNDIDKEIVYELFFILNNIVETQITQPKRNDELYNTILNQNTRESIKKRDSQK